MKSRRGARIRLLCRTCGRTFCGRRGTAYYRLQHPRRTFDQFATLLGEGLSCASLSRALGVCPGTISRWLERAAKHARSFAEEFDRVADPVELQFDEISARPANQPGCPWVFNAIEVSSRFWAAALVGGRTRRTTRAFVVRARNACANLHAKLLITSDPFPYYEQALRQSFGPACIYAQVENSYGQDHVKRSNTTVVLGSRSALADTLFYSEDSKRPNTAYVERLNLRLRRSCSYLHRRTSGRVRNPERLASVVEIVRCAYNFIRPHARLQLGHTARTPAMVAGIFDRILSWSSVFAWPAPPPKPASVLARALPTIRLTTWLPRGRRRWQRGDLDDSVAGS
jgi:transposase-like protein